MDGRRLGVRLDVPAFGEHNAPPLLSELGYGAAENRPPGRRRRGPLSGTAPDRRESHGPQASPIPKMADPMVRPAATHRHPDLHARRLTPRIRPGLDIALIGVPFRRRRDQPDRARAHGPREIRKTSRA